MHKVNIFYFCELCLVLFQQCLLTQSLKCPFYFTNVLALMISITGIFASLTLHVCSVGFHSWCLVSLCVYWFPQFSSNLSVEIPWVQRLKWALSEWMCAGFYQALETTICLEPLYILSLRVWSLGCKLYVTWGPLHNWFLKVKGIASRVIDPGPIFTFHFCSSFVRRN